MIRTATRSDLPAVVDIENLSFAEPWDMRTFRSYVHHPGFIVFEEDGSICGYAILVVIADDAHLASIAIHTEYRRMLLAKVNSFPLVRLEVREKNKTAQDFYLANGFEAVATIPDYYPDDNAIVMERRT
jgi:ribosomal-protein-alanine N-acetyltransferase